MTTNQNKNQLPEGWKYEVLESALEYVIGGDWGKDEDFQDSNYGVAYCIRGSEIKNWEKDKGCTASLRKIKLTNIVKRKLKYGDILVEISGGGPDQPVGRTVVIDQTVLNFQSDIPKVCTNFLRLLRTKNNIDGNYLNYFLKLFYYSGEIIKYQGGSNNLRNLKFSDYLKITFPLPPLPTQHLIVSKIESLFTQLDKGIESLRSAQQQLKIYRQAVLKWAFEGRLTNDNVKDGELPEGWKWVTLGDLVSDVEYGSAAKSKESGKIPVIRMGNIQNGRIDYEDLVFTDDDAEISKYLLKTNDVLFNRTNSAELVGKTAIFKNERPAIFAGYLIRVNRIESLLDGDYLNYFLNTKFAKDYGNTVRSFGVNQSNINGSKLKTYPIPIADIEEQKIVVKEIESRLDKSNILEQTITQSLAQAEVLKQCILKMAFEGRLCK